MSYVIEVDSLEVMLLDFNLNFSVEEVIKDIFFRIMEMRSRS